MPVAIEFELSEADKARIVEKWNLNPLKPPSIKDLLIALYGEEKVKADNLDSRTIQGRKIKEFLISKDINFRKSYLYEKKEAYILTEEEKKLIEENIRMPFPEMVKVVFKNPDQNQLTLDSRAALAYKNLISPKPVAPLEDLEDYADGKYNPPKSLSRAVVRVNKYVLDGLDAEKLTPQDKNNCFALIKYLHTYRFNSQINTYEGTDDRELFESTFIRCTYDKDDLTEEEVDQYISYSTEIVIARKTATRIEEFENIQDKELMENGRPNMALVEAIKTLSTERNASSKRQEELLKVLKVTRSDRLTKYRKEHSSLLTLISEWKNEESRLKMLALAEKRKAKFKDEVQQLDNMSEFIARIMGADPNAIINE